MVISFSGYFKSSAAALRKHCCSEKGCRPIATPKCRKKHLQVVKKECDRCLSNSRANSRKVLES